MNLRKKQELQQINARFFNSEKSNPPLGGATMKTIDTKRKRQAVKYGYLIWNAKTNGTFTGSVRDTFNLRPR